MQYLFFGTCKISLDKYIMTIYLSMDKYQILLFSDPILTIVFLFVCFEVLSVNGYGHVETVSSPNHTFFLGKLD